MEPEGTDSLWVTEQGFLTGNGAPMFTDNGIVVLEQRGRWEGGSWEEGLRAGRTAVGGAGSWRGGGSEPRPSHDHTPFPPGGSGDR